MATETLHPYALLGVGLDSKPADVRRAYYQLALIAHPDRGGTDDQMRALHAAYVYVSRQIEHGASAAGRTLDTEQAAFDAFLAAQMAAPTAAYECIRDIEDEVYQRATFERLWNEQTPAECWRAAVPGGYGACMAPSEFGAVPDATVGTHESVAREATTTPLPVDFGTRTLQRYIEPHAAPARCTLPSAAAACPPAALDDYTADATLPTTDYRRAFESVPDSPPPALDAYTGTVVAPTYKELLAALPPVTRPQVTLLPVPQKPSETSSLRGQ